MLTEIEQPSIYITSNSCQASELAWAILPKIKSKKLGKDSAVYNSVTTTANQITQKENFWETEVFLELLYVGVLGCGALQPEAEGGQRWQPEEQVGEAFSMCKEISL